ncbi:MAG: TIM barrel protein [Dermatophilaceae bacterium]
MGSVTDAVQSAGAAHDVTRRRLMKRIAGAPICWGVCEVPGWGYQLDRETVLGQMKALGFAATEYGPDGFLPDRPEDKVATLAEYDLRAVGQFVPVVLHDPDHDPLPEVEIAMQGLLAADAKVVVIAAATGVEGYDSRPELDDAQWATLLANLDRISDAAAEHGLLATIHPHVGTLVESGEDTDRVLAGSHIHLCLDTGHLLIGGGDPVAVATAYPHRIGHMHLKDVRADLARRVQDGTLTYTQAVESRMYVPLGTGDVDIAAIVTSLERSGYDGWYVLEQDTVLDGPLEGEDNRSVADVRTSLAHLDQVMAALEETR